MSRKAAKTPAAGRGVQDISPARRAQLTPARRRPT